MIQASRLLTIGLAAITLSAQSMKLEQKKLEIIPLPNIEIEVEEEVQPWYTEEEVEVLTNLLYGEARGIKETDRQAAVIWCVLNRVDAGYGTILQVSTAPHQFTGYKANRVYKDLNAYQRCREIVIDVLERYGTEEQIGRTLPREYMWFYGNGKQNIFRDAYKGSYNIWDWSLESPYVE